MRTGIAKLCHFLRQKLDTVGRCTVNLRLEDQVGIEVMQLLPFFEVGVIFVNSSMRLIVYPGYVQNYCK